MGDARAGGGRTFPLGEAAVSNTESVRSLVTCSSLTVRSKRSGVTTRAIDAVAVDSTMGRPGESLVLPVRTLLKVDVVDIVGAVLSLRTAYAENVY